MPGNAKYSFRLTSRSDRLLGGIENLPAQLVSCRESSAASHMRPRIRIRCDGSERAGQTFGRDNPFSDSGCMDQPRDPRWPTNDAYGGISGRRHLRSIRTNHRRSLRDQLSFDRNLACAQRDAHKSHAGHRDAGANYQSRGRRGKPNDFNPARSGW